MKKIVDISKIKPGRFIIHEGEAYKVKDIQHSKAGKHGHGKYRLSAVSITSGKKVSIVKGSGHNIDVPIIDKRNAQVLTISEETEQRGTETIHKTIANVMDSESYETFDLEVPEEFKGQVKEGGKIMYWSFLGNKLLQQVLE